MTSVQATKLIDAPTSDLFDLVLDLEHYPEFVPHCHEVRVISRRTDEQGNTIILSRMTVGFSALEVSYVNRTTGDPVARQINVESRSGPLQLLRVQWSFEPCNDGRTKVHFSVNYEFSNPVLAAVASRAFATMYGEILNAFERRAVHLFRHAHAVGSVRPA